MHGSKAISLQKLGRDFFAPKDSAMLGSYDISEVVRKDAGWEITLKGQWKVRPTLNDKYEIEKTERVE